MQFIPDLNYDIWTILFLGFCLLVFIQLCYTLFIYGRLAFYKDRKEQESDLPPVTIIIAARNEADNIYENLPYILSQDYPEFEVLVIDHQSTDESKHILQAYQQQYSNLRFSHVERSKHLRAGKKLPLTIGMKGAKYEHILLTDADCKPSSDQWIKSMAGQFSSKKEIILGYGPYKQQKGWLNKIIRFDTAWIAINYFSFALSKLPYMGVGRNLAYTKSLFFNNDGFKSHYSLPSGDDDLFIQDTAKNKNYSINISPESYCYSEPHDDWGSWIRQKTRHYTTSNRYKVIKKLMLGIYPLTMLLMYISFVSLLINEEFRLIALTLFGGIIIIKWWIQGICFKKINETSFIPYLPLTDFAYTVIMPVIYYTSERKTTNKW